jgi:hypothetical protein
MQRLASWLEIDPYAVYSSFVEQSRQWSPALASKTKSL